MSALAGIKVLDLSRVLAGPSCGQLFADMGAEVIKVEDRQGDENRNWLPVVDGRGANYMSVNRGKQGITLNLKHPRGQELLAQLDESLFWQVHRSVIVNHRLVYHDPWHISAAWARYVAPAVGSLLQSALR